MNGDLFDTSLLITKLPNVTDCIPDIDIFRHYEPNLNLGTQKNPFKIELKSPSFSMYEKHERIWFKDHSGGMQGDVYDFVKEWYKVHRGTDLSFSEVNRAIYYDMKLSENDTVNNRLFFNDDETGPNQRKAGRKEKFGLQVKDIGWTDWAINYWIERYNISPSILKAYHCGHAKEVWATPPGGKTYLWGVSTEANPIFYFYFPKTGNMKCYRPLEKNKKKKWIMNCNNETDIQGYYQMRIKQTRPKVLIFTKALKEVMFYRSFHIDAIAIHGEDHIYSDDFMRHVRKYSENQIAVYDNEWRGRISALKFRQRHNVEQFLIQGAKNITDLWEKDPQAVKYYIDLFKAKYDL